MDGFIELTTTPTKYPKRLKRKAWIFFILMSLILCAQFAIAMSRFHISWPDLLERLASIPSRILSGDDMEGFVVLVVMPIAGWFAIQSERLRLRITPLYIECSSRLPTWAKFGQSDWRIERRQILSVRVDLARGATLARAARVRFNSKDTPRTLPVLGWFRVGQDVETQQIGVRKGFLKTDFAGQVQTLPIVIALKEAGLEPVIDAGPVRDPLRKTPYGWALAISCISAMVYALIAIMNWHDLYATQPPWLFITAVAGLAAYLAWEIVRRSSMTGEEKIMGVVAAAAMFGLAAWAGAPRLNAMTSAGPQEVIYRYAGNGIFKPERADAPNLDLSRYVVSLHRWKPGDEVVLHLRRGMLGFWQYDRDLAITALDSKSR